MRKGTPYIFFFIFRAGPLREALQFLNVLRHVCNITMVRRGRVHCIKSRGPVQIHRDDDTSSLLCTRNSYFGVPIRPNDCGYLLHNAENSPARERTPAKGASAATSPPGRVARVLIVRCRYNYRRDKKFVFVIGNIPPANGPAIIINPPHTYTIGNRCVYQWLVIVSVYVSSRLFF